MCYSIKAVKLIVYLFRKINKFGSLSHIRINSKWVKQSEVVAEIKDYILEASEEELCKVPGVGPNAAMFLRLIRESGRYYELRLQDGPVILNTISDCARYLSKQFYGRRVETVFFLALDGKKRLIACQKLSEGDLNTSLIPTRVLVDALLSLNASAVVLAHNHPGGLALPSQEDIAVTANIAAVLEALDIAFVDHLVFSEDDWVSMVQSGRYLPKRR